MRSLATGGRPRGKPLPRAAGPIASLAVELPALVKQDFAAANSVARLCHGLPAPLQSYSPSPWRGTLPGNDPRRGQVFAMGGSARFATGGRASGKALLRRVGPALPCVAEPVAKLRIWRQDCGEACHLRRGPRQGFPAEAHSKGLAREVGPAATQGLATGCRARGKALPRRPGPRRGLATDDRARRKELPRTAGPWPWAPEPVATLCQASGRALPRAARPAAAFRGGRPGPWQGCAAGGRAPGKASTRALPRAAGSVARPCHRRPDPRHARDKPLPGPPRPRRGQPGQPTGGRARDEAWARGKTLPRARGNRSPGQTQGFFVGVAGKALPRGPLAVAGLCHGQPNSRQGRATKLAVRSGRRGKPLPRAAGSAARLIHGRPWQSLSANVAADDKGGPAARGKTCQWPSRPR